MTFRPRAKTIAAAVGLALGPLAATGAQADSAVGVDTSINSSLNTGVARDPVSVDPEFEPRRSPIGLLYPRAPVAAEKEVKDRIDHFLNNKGTKPVDDFHRALGKAYTGLGNKELAAVHSQYAN